MALFIHYDGFCSNEINDYVKAIFLYNQAIASYKLAFDDESNNYKALDILTITQDMLLKSAIIFQKQNLFMKPRLK